VFSLEECAFVFIDSILVRLHSDNLRRLGCRITDCPGFFANAYDTQRAEKAIHEADAIWYLIDGRKVIGEKDIEKIRQIYEWGMQGKIEATANLRDGSHEHQITDVLPGTVCELGNNGYEMNVHQYNARLAFLAMQGKLLLTNQKLFSPTDYENMKSDAGKSCSLLKPEQLWQSMVSKLGENIDVEDVANCEILNEDSVRIVRQHSYFDEILASLENSLISKKSKNILVDKGSDRAANALLEYEGKLQSDEHILEIEVEKWQEEAKASKKRLNDFIEESQKIIENSSLGKDGVGDLASQIAESIIVLSFDEKLVESLSYDIASVLVKNIESRFILSKNGVMKKIEDNIIPLFQKSFFDALTRGINEWGQKTGYQSIEYMKERLGKIGTELTSKWKELHLDDDEVLQGFRPPAVTEDDIEKIHKELTILAFQKNKKFIDLAEKMRSGFTGIFRCLWNWVKPKSEDEENEKINNLAMKCKVVVKEIIDDYQFRLGYANLIKEKIMDCSNPDNPSGMLPKIKNNLKMKLKKMCNEFEDKVKEAKKNFNLNLEERNKKATEYHRLRTKEIKPLRERIQSFRDDVMKDLS